MATTKGSQGLVKIGTNTVAEVISFSVDHQVELVDDTELSDTDKTHLADIKSWSGSIECHWDPTDTNGQEAMDVGASVTLNLYHEGATTGDIYYTGTATITSISRSNSAGETVKASFSFTGNGALTQATAA